MDYIEELLSKLALCDYEVGAEQWVDVTHINTPHNFYVRPTLCRRYMSVINAFDKRFLQPSEIPAGSTIIYRSELLKAAVRGRVLVSRTEGKQFICHVYAMDYGCYEKYIQLEDIHKPLHSKDTPPLAIQCKLADCIPHLCYWSKEIIDDMKTLLGDERAMLFVRDKSLGLLTVDLFNSCPHDISTMLSFDGHTSHGYEDRKINRYRPAETKRQYYSCKKYKVGDVLNVQVQSGENLESFYVIEIKDYQPYLNYRDKLSIYCDFQGGIVMDDIVKGSAIGVETYFNKYERGLVKSITPENQQIRVLLVDGGKHLNVPLCKLKPMAERHYLKPAVSIYCSADTSQEWDNGEYRFLYPGYKFTITIEELGDKFNKPHVVRVSPLIEI